MSEADRQLDQTGTLAEEEHSVWSKIIGDSLVAPFSAKVIASEFALEPAR